jgi:hypothetical protein
MVLLEEIVSGNHRGEAHIVLSHPMTREVMFDKWLPATLQYIRAGQLHVQLDRELGMFGADWDIEPDCWRPDADE